MTLNDDERESSGMDSNELMGTSTIITKKDPFVFQATFIIGNGIWYDNKSPILKTDVGCSLGSSRILPTVEDPLS